jgi:hypothetical protein
VFITHIKESLAPHPSGKTARERIMQELRGLERSGQLGVEFVEVKKGDRICELTAPSSSLEAGMDYSLTGRSDLERDRAFIHTSSLAEMNRGSAT